MKNFRKLLSKRLAPSAAAVVLLTAGQVAMATSVTVRVIDSHTLRPVSGASVCIGSRQQPQVYGAMRTDAAGEIHAQTPQRDFILSVSGDGHGDYVQEQASRNFDTVYHVELDAGKANSHCVAPVLRSEGPLGKEALSLVYVNIDAHSHTAGTVDVSAEVDGLEPTHIRVSTSTDFSDSSWVPYSDVTRHSVARVSSEKLYVQVKRALTEGKSSIEAVSTARAEGLHQH